MSTIQIKTSVNNGNARISMAGRFDFNSHRQFREAYQQVLDDLADKEIKIDLGAVDYLGSGVVQQVLDEVIARTLNPALSNAHQNLPTCSKRYRKSKLNVYASRTMKSRELALIIVENILIIKRLFSHKSAPAHGRPSAGWHWSTTYVQELSLQAMLAKLPLITRMPEATAKLPSRPKFRRGRPVLRPWGIKGRVLFLALVPALVIAAGLTFYDISTRLRDIEQALNGRGFAIVRQLAPAAEYGVFSGNYDVLARLAQSTLQEADVTAVTIINSDGRILAVGGHALAVPSRSEIASPKSGVIESSDVLLFSAPIFQSQTEVENYLDPVVQIPHLVKRRNQGARTHPGRDIPPAQHAQEKSDHLQQPADHAGRAGNGVITGIAHGAPGYQSDHDAGGCCGQNRQGRPCHPRPDECDRRTCDAGARCQQHGGGSASGAGRPGGKASHPRDRA